MFVNSFKILTCPNFLLRIAPYDPNAINQNFGSGGFGGNGFGGSTNAPFDPNAINHGFGGQGFGKHTVSFPYRRAFVFGIVLNVLIYLETINCFNSINCVHVARPISCG